VTDLDDEAHRLAAALSQGLGADALGVYLHGSAVLGGWVAGASDLDVLVVLTGESCDLDALSDACRRASAPVELSAITQDAAARPSAPWPFVGHVTTRPDKCLVDAGAGDPDLLMHIAVTREHGRVLIGPHPRRVFSEVPPADIAAYLRTELQWGLDHADEAYAVLNACRALCWCRTGRLVSKIDGGIWAMRELPGRSSLIGRALADQRAGVCRAPVHEDARGLVGLVRAELGAAGDA